MPRGYLEGPASEEREAALERGDHLERERAHERRAVYGSTEDDSEQHFIGWAETRSTPTSCSHPAVRGA